MTSQLRPETEPYYGKQKSLDYATSFWMCTEAVAKAKGLAFGHLHDRTSGLSCAIGTLWDASPKVILDSTFIDEVAAVNDMLDGKETPVARQKRVLRWLRWKIRVLAMARPQKP